MLTVRMKSCIDLCNQTYALPTKSISTSLPFSPSPPLPPPPFKRERDDPLWGKKNHCYYFSYLCIYTKVVMVTVI